MVRLVSHQVVCGEAVAETKVPGGVGGKLYLKTKVPGGGGGKLYLKLHSHLQNDSCIKMSSIVSHFHVSFTVEEQSPSHTMSMGINHNLRKES